MIVKTFYDNGHYDVFDTSSLVNTDMFPDNVMTNYSLAFADLEEHGALWLNIYCHEYRPEFSETMNCHGLPVARRRDSCCVLIADSEDLQHLQKVLVDEQVFLLREGDDFIEGFKLNAAVERTRFVNAAVVETAKYLLAAGAASIDECLERLGVPSDAYTSMAAAHEKNRESSGEGDGDEGRF